MCFLGLQDPPLDTLGLDLLTTSSQAGEWVEQGTSGEGGEQGGKSILGLETIEDSLMKAWGQAGEISEVMEERGRGHQSPPVVSTQTRGAGSRAWWAR